jgi:hypothetical protein
LRRELSGDDHLLQLVDIFLDFDVREYVFPTGFDGDRKLLAVGGYGLDDHRIFARGSRKFEIAVPVGHPAEYRIFQRNRDVFGRSAVCGDDIARDFDLYPVLSRCGQDGQ